MVLGLRDVSRCDLRQVGCPCPARSGDLLRPLPAKTSLLAARRHRRAKIHAAAEAAAVRYRVHHRATRRLR